MRKLHWVTFAGCRCDCGCSSRASSAPPQQLLLQTQASNEVSPCLLGECKYDFQAWGECDVATGKKNRTGVLRRALMDATCASTVTATKPCRKIPKLQGNGC